MANLREQNDWIDWAHRCRFDDGRLAEFFAVSPGELTDVFLCLLFRSPGDWLAVVAMWEAARLLCAGRTPGEVAAELGFASESEFAHRFEFYHGISPCEFAGEVRRRQEAKRTYLETTFGADGYWKESLEPPWTLAFRNLCPHSNLVEKTEPPVLRPGRALLVKFLHAKLCCPLSESQATAARETLAELLLPRLVRRLSTEFAHTDPQFICEAVESAILDYLRRPTRFDPNRSELETFLRQAAWRNVVDLRRSEDRRRRREDEAGENLQILCQISSPVANIQVEDELEVCGRERQRDEEQIEQFRKGLSAVDCQMIELWLKGEKCYRPFAQVLGVADLPVGDQQRIVNREKNRVHKVVVRFARRGCPDAQTYGLR